MCLLLSIGLSIGCIIACLALCIFITWLLERLPDWVGITLFVIIFTLVIIVLTTSFYAEICK